MLLVGHQRGGLRSTSAYHCVTGCLNLLYEVGGKWVNDKVHSHYNYSMKWISLLLYNYTDYGMSGSRGLYGFLKKR